MLLYLGWDIEPMPTRDADRVLAEFGPTRGMELAEAAKAVDTEVVSSPVDWSVDTYEGASLRLRDSMRQRHPELSDEAIKALGWSFDWLWR